MVGDRVKLRNGLRKLANQTPCDHEPPTPPPLSPAPSHGIDVITLHSWFCSLKLKGFTTLGFYMQSILVYKCVYHR